MATVPQEVVAAMRGVPLDSGLRGGYHFLNTTEIAAYQSQVLAALVADGYQPGTLGTFGAAGAFEQAMKAWADGVALGQIATPNSAITEQTGILVAAIDGLTKTGDPTKQYHITVFLDDGRRLVLMNTHAASANYFDVGNSGFAGLMHEIGHALGLEHPFAESLKPAAVPQYTDSYQYTVMSYTGHADGYIPVTPQLYDFGVLQETAMYGVNAGTRSGSDSTYRFISAAGAPITYDLSGNGQTFRMYYPEGAAVPTAPMVTIWDAGNGSGDRIDASAVMWSVRIDLNQAEFSSILAINDVSIAYGAQIENAIGTAYADTLVGNELGNELEGRKGNDYLFGEEGNDAYKFDTTQGDLGLDTILDTGGDGQIKIDGQALAGSSTPTVSYLWKDTQGYSYYFRPELGAVGTLRGGPIRLDSSRWLAKWILCG